MVGTDPGTNQAEDGGTIAGATTGVSTFVDTKNPLDVRSARFLIHSDRAANLYVQIERLPIVDYHNHISPKAVAEDLKFENATQVILGSLSPNSPVFDHYLARLLREFDLDEDVVSGTGGLSDYDRFKAIATVFPDLAPNPTYQWTVMTLSQYFGVNTPLCAETADSIWETVNAKLTESEFSARGLLAQRRVSAICTTDDPTDSLEFHVQYAAENADMKMLPTFRPDRALYIVRDRRNDFGAWVTKLGETSQMSVDRFHDFLAALKSRHEFFIKMGCKAADIGLYNFPRKPKGQHSIEQIYQKARQGGQTLTDTEIACYQYTVLTEIARWNAEAGWVTQYHQGPLRDVNGTLFDRVGADAGGDAMGPMTDLDALAAFLGDLDASSVAADPGRNPEGTGLGRSIFYPLNPHSYEPVISIIKGFAGRGMGSRLHLGVPWWFSDTGEGNRKFIEITSNNGILRKHPGMLTDARSFLSFIRHDFVRRIKADEVVKRMPEFDDDHLLEVLTDLCYRNAAEFFNIEV